MEPKRISSKILAKRAIAEKRQKEIIALREEAVKNLKTEITIMLQKIKKIVDDPKPTYGDVEILKWCKNNIKDTNISL
jgi:hypothetical protein